MPTTNKRFSVKYAPRHVKRLAMGPYENNEERQYYKTKEDSWDIMVDDRVLESFYTESAAQKYFFEQLTIPGINSVFQKRGKVMKAQIRELEASLKGLDTERKKFIEKRNDLLRKAK